MNKVVVKFWEGLPVNRRRWIVVSVTTLVLFTVVGFLIAPPIVKHYAVKVMSEQLGREVVIEEIDLNPYALSATISGFQIKEKSGKPFVSWDRVYANFELISVFNGTITFDEILAVNPYANVQVLADRTLNFSDILGRLEQASEKSEQATSKAERPFRIGRFEVTAGRLEYLDESLKTPFHTIVGPSTIKLEKFSTRPDNRNPYSFSATTESGEKLIYSGYFFLGPLRSGGEFSLENIFLKKYAPYFQDQVNLEISDGYIDLKSAYEVEFSNRLDVARITNAIVQLKSVKIKERGSGESDPVVDIGNITVADTDVDVVAQRARVGSLSTSNSFLLVQRFPDASINLLNLVKPASGTRLETRGSTPTTTNVVNATPVIPWNLTVEKMQVADYRIFMQDLTTSRPAALAISDVQLSATNFSTQPGSVLGADLSLRWNTNGWVSTKSLVCLMPLTCTTEFEVTDFELQPLDPYLEPFLNVYVNSGNVSTSGRVSLNLTNLNQPQVEFAGDIQLANFSMLDGVKSEDLLKFSKLQLQGLKCSLDPMQAALDEIVLVDPYLMVSLDEQGTNNLSRILRVQSAEIQTEPAIVSVDAEAKPLPPVAISKISFTNGTIAVVDRSIQPEASMGIRHLSGDVQGLSTDELQRADVNITARVDNTGPVRIFGKINPLNDLDQTDLTVEVADVDLMPASPYVGKYAGYSLSRGKLNLNLKYLISKRKLDAKNLVVVDQLTLGDKVESPDATKLPVRLAIAMLQDPEGKIEIDMPIEGNLDEPEFRYGKVVVKTLMNIMLKVATSPFHLLGAIVGGAGEELSYQEFAPGEFTLNAPEQLNKPALLMKALSSRPKLSIDIEGSVDPEKDRQAIGRNKIIQSLRVEKFQRLRKRNSQIQSTDQVEVSAEEYANTVEDLFRKMPETNRLAILNLLASSSTNAPVVQPETSSSRISSVPRELLLSTKNFSEPRMELTVLGRGVLRPAWMTALQLEVRKRNVHSPSRKKSCV